jgi:hypothetical protein
LLDNQEGQGEGVVCVTEEDCKGRKGNLAQLHNLFCTSTILCNKSETGKKLKIDDFLKKSQPEDPPHTSSEILPSTSMTTNAKLNTTDFFQ